MPSLEAPELTPVDNREQQENESHDSYESAQLEKRTYTDLSTESQMEIDRTVESNMHNVAQAIKDIQEFGRQARDAGSPEESAYAFTLEQKYAGLLLDVKNALAEGKSVEVALPNKEDIEAEIERDLRSLQFHVEKAETAHKAEVAEAERHQQANLASSQQEVTAAYAADIPAVSEAPPPQPAVSERAEIEPEEVQADAESAKKLGYFEKRRRQKAMKVYGAIDQLSTKLENSTFTGPNTGERARAYTDALNRLYAGGTVDNEAIKGGEKFLQELQDAELRDRKDIGGTLSKAELKRLNKISR